jgi:hypothetical protein
MGVATIYTNRRRMRMPSKYYTSKKLTLKKLAMELKSAVRIETASSPEYRAFLASLIEFGDAMNDDEATPEYTEQIRQTYDAREKAYFNTGMYKISKMIDQLAALVNADDESEAQ